MGDIFLLSLVAAANASLLAAVTVMLFLPSPKRLLLGYLAGALLTSLTIGFLVVFVVDDASATSTAENSVSPSIDVALGLDAAGQKPKVAAQITRAIAKNVDKPDPAVVFEFETDALTDGRLER